MSDKISIDNFSSDDYDTTDSDNASSVDDKEFLTFDPQLDNTEGDVEELMPFGDDESENSIENFVADSDIESEDNGPHHNIDEFNWGVKTRNYYHTDADDSNLKTYDENGIELAKLEEEEARNIQKRLAKELEDEDFLLDEVILKSTQQENSSVNVKEAKLVITDISRLTQEQIEDTLLRDSPELKGLINDFNKYLIDVNNLLTPVMNYVRKNNFEINTALKFSQFYEKLILNYCLNISYYLLLKIRRLDVKHHPITKRLIDLKKLLIKLKSKYENIVKPQIETILKHIKDVNKYVYMNPSTHKNKTNVIKERNIKQAKNAANDDSVNNSNNIEHYNAKDDVDRRGITYQIAKNKGLTSSRKKDLRNPRVRHRNKFRKALIRRKGAVRGVRKETTRYGGEISGIKATVSKSIKFKS